ncbi:hypothetical protein G6011_01884 [Alternaria panax]|uniref:Uncharacterized protein n=1 Tax=Alternaria panax TaxID=48097 RepID=A0AAD4I8K7_9PLEO|nr:hypothetical protein G6011_01884 [Alternaria panax]
MHYNHFVHEPFDVVEGSETYTKEQLLVKLKEACLDALAKFPAPDTFEIGERRRPGRYKLRVGYTVTRKSRKVGETLWLDERKHAHAPVYDEFNHSRGAYCRTEQEWKIRRRQISLYDSNTEDAYRNRHVKNAEMIRGDGIFDKLTDSGLISPFSLTMKAVLRFVLVYCDRATECRTFESEGKKKAGLAPLIRALRKIAERTPDSGDDSTDSAEEEGDEASVYGDKKGGTIVEEDSDAGPAGTDKEDNLLAMEDGAGALFSLKDKKRKGAMDTEFDERTAAKKSRAC